VKFLIDENLPPALRDWLVEWGHEAVHVHDIGLARTLDENVAAIAFVRGEIIIYKDSHFADLSLIGRSQARLVWVRCGSLSLGAFRQWFGARFPSVIEQLTAGAELIELR
jgi:predicted nuclease of predicted toxin-antitoxin system